MPWNKMWVQFFCTTLYACLKPCSSPPKKSVAPGTVSQVRAKWASFEDGAFAEQLQRQEIQQFYQG